MEDVEVGIIKVCHHCGQGIMTNGVCSICGARDGALLKDSLEKTPIEDYKDCKMCGYMDISYDGDIPWPQCLKYPHKRVRYDVVDGLVDFLQNNACPDYRKARGPRHGIYIPIYKGDPSCVSGTTED